MGAGSSIRRGVIEAKAGAKAAASTSEAVQKFIKSRQVWRENGAKFYAWHDRTVEEALEPELQIVDPHHHLWDMRELQGWNGMGLFKQGLYLQEELMEDIIVEFLFLASTRSGSAHPTPTPSLSSRPQGCGHNITHTVYVETHQFQDKDAAEPVMAPLGEVQFAQGIAAQFASGKYGAALRAVAGIVGSADLQKYGADAKPLLEACKFRCPNFRGIRDGGHYDAKLTDGFRVKAPSKYLDARFREGFALLEPLGLTFDAFVFSSQLSDLHSLATAFPKTTIVLNHQGSPM